MTDKQAIDFPSLEKVIVYMPGYVYWMDKHGYYLGCNENSAKLFGLSSPQAIIGKTAYDLVDKKYADAIVEIDQSVMSAGHELVFEENGVDANLNPAIYLTRKVPLKDDDGKIVGMVGISIDITDRKRLEMDLLKAKEKAEAANQAKTEFLQNMRHDLRTPFSGIIGFTSLLEKAETDETKKEQLKYVLESSEQLLNLLNEIIDASNVATGGLIIKHEPFKLPPLLESVTQLMQAEIKYKQLTLTMQCSPDIPSTLLGDRLRLHRILLNLLGNAIKFTESGQVSLNVEVLNCTERKVYLKFSVADTGIGIPADKFEVVFDRFTRLTPSYEGNYPGSGIGLYIVKTFVDDLEGKIEIESKEGKGSCFSCFLNFDYF